MGLFPDKKVPFTRSHLGAKKKGSKARKDTGQG